MKSKKLVLICTATLVAMSTLFVSCGSNDKVKLDGKAVSENVKGNENKEDGKVIDVEEKKEVKVDFSKYSDEFLVSFLNEGRDEFIEKIGKSTGIPDHYVDKTGSYIELSRPLDTVEKRKELIEKYYAPGVYEEEYVEKEGKTYIKTPYYKDHIPYDFQGVKSREVTGNNSLKVKFNVGFYHGYPVVNKNVKTVEFKEINGELRATSLFEEGSMLNAIENKDESKPCLDDKQKELFDYVTKELDSVLRADQTVTGISERYYDEKSDSTYYGIIVTEPTQSPISYFVNMKNGSIYGHYKGKFVVAPKK